MVTFPQTASLALSLHLFSLPPLLFHEKPASTAQQIAPGTIAAIALPYVHPRQVAQASPPSPLEASDTIANAAGTQIRINGRTITAPWAVSGGELFIAEDGLTQRMGVELLSTNDYNQQPLQWFTPPDESASIATSLFVKSSRLLNISSLAAAEGWAWEHQNGLLSLSTAKAQVVGVRQSSQSWGDRVVVDLDQATPWQILRSGNEVVITIDATLQAEGLPPVTLQPGSRVSSIQVQSSGQQTLIKITKPASLYAQTETLAAPNRIVIDLQPTPTKTFSIQWAPGLWWHQKIVSCGGQQCPVTVLEANLDASTLDMRPIWSNSATVEGTTPLRSMAQQWQAIASINGGFFNRNNKLPLGAIRHNGEWFSGPILNRGAIAWTPDGEFALGRLSLQETLTTEAGVAIALKHLNSGYVQAGVSRYSPSWGATYATLTDYETIVTVQNQEVTHQQTVETAGARVAIPKDGYILAVRANNSILGTLAVGTKVNVATSTLPEEFEAFSEIIGAGPLLLQDSQMALNAQAEQFSDAFIQQRAARSAIGLTENNHVLLVIAQRQVDGSGITLNQIAQIMQSLGATDALNLDGGSSTTLTLGERVLNDAPDSVAQVNNGIGIFWNSEEVPPVRPE